MTSRRSYGMLIVALSMAISMLACNLGKTAAPTSQPTFTSAPLPTQTTPPTEPPTPTTKPTSTSAPTATQAPTEAPLEKPTDEPVGELTLTAPNIVAGALNILTTNSFVDEFDDWNIAGLVRNDTERMVNDIEIEIEIFDAQDNSVYKEVAYTSLSNLAPGEVSPFDLWVYEDLPGADHFTATIVGNGTNTYSERIQGDVSKVTFTVDDYQYAHLTGLITNNTDQPMDVNTVAGVLFDIDQNILDAQTESVILNHLEPGESGPFRITFSGLGNLVEAIDTYQFYIDSVVGSEPDYYDLKLSDDHNDYMDAYDSYHLVGTLTNNSSQYINASLVATILDKDGNVLDVSSTSLPMLSIAPGETLPYDFDYWGPIDASKDVLAKADRYRVQVDWYWTWDSTTQLIDLALSDETNTFDEYNGTFAGKVVNNSGMDLDYATVVVYLYDRQTEQVLMMGYDSLWDELPDGASADFEVTVPIPPDFNVDSIYYDTLVKGEPK